MRILRTQFANLKYKIHFAPRRISSCYSKMKMFYRRNSVCGDQTLVKPSPWSECKLGKQVILVVAMGPQFIYVQSFIRNKLEPLLYKHSTAVDIRMAERKTNFAKDAMNALLFCYLVSLLVFQSFQSCQSVRRGGEAVSKVHFSILWEEERRLCEAQKM